MTAHSVCDVTISIINYRTAALTIACAESVLSDLEGINGHIVIVDNASGDGSEKTLATWIAQHPNKSAITLVISQTNSGFSGGHNQGMAACPAQFYLLLNSDAFLRKGFLSEILSTAADHPQSGLIAPQLEGDDGIVQVSRFRFQSPASELIRAAGSSPVTRLLKRYVVALPQQAAVSEADWVSFACVLLRDTMIRSIGPMDEGYFLYFEDEEYCLRAQRAGWQIAASSKAVAVHYRGGSGPVKALQTAHKRLPSYYYASRSRFLYQAHGQAGLIAANLAWHLGRGIAQFKRIFGKPVFPTAIKEARDIWINVRKPLGSRRAPEE